MFISNILKKSWFMVWRYRALWFFGMLLALAVGTGMASTGTWWFSGGNYQNDMNWGIRFGFDEDAYPKFLKDGGTIDLDNLDQYAITFEGWQSFDAMLLDFTELGIMPLIIECTIIFASIVFLLIFTRYVAETALMRMMDESEKTGVKPGFGKGLRMGFSLRAFRLFLIDFLVVILAILGLALWFGPITSLFLVSIPLGELTVIFRAFASMGLFAVGAGLLLIGGILISLVMQPIRRACVLDDLGCFKAIGRGIRMTKQHFTETGLTWLAWVGTRILWAPLSVLVAIVLSPLILLTFLAGLAAGGMVTLVVGGIISQVMSSAVIPWIMGVAAGLPVLILLTSLPLVFVSGWVQVFLSSLWTLYYREMRQLEVYSPTLMPEAKLKVAPGTAS